MLPFWKAFHVLLILKICGYRNSPIDLRSLQHLVDFIDNSDSREAAITGLRLLNVRLSEPSDGGLDVLRGFFARSDTTLEKVKLEYCHFGNQEDASQLLAAFETNRTVTGLTIRQIRNLEGTRPWKFSLWFAAKHAAVATAGVFRVCFRCGWSTCISAGIASESNFERIESFEL
jgi:hypothetical protein